MHKNRPISVNATRAADEARFESCCFCLELLDGYSDDVVMRFGRPVRRLMWESEDFVVAPTLGQLAFGHLLVIPKVHTTSMCQIQESRLAQAERAISEVERSVAFELGDFVSFEHGMQNGGSGGCGIDHAHLHIVPIDRRIKTMPRVANDWTQLSRVGWLEETRTRVDSDYLYLRGQDGTRYVTPVEEVPSQFMRIWLSSQTDNPLWDWREYGFEPNLLRTLSWMSDVAPPRGYFRFPARVGQ